MVAALVLDGTADEVQRAELPPKQLVLAEQDLEWRYRVADHADARGAQAQHYGGAGGGVFDEAASDRLHASLHTWRQSDTVHRMRVVDATLAQLDDGGARLRRIYELRRWYRPLSEAMQVATVSLQGTGGQVSLAWLLPIMQRVRDAWASAHPKASEAPGDAGILSWANGLLTPSVRKGVLVQQQPPGWFARARSECEALRDELLTEYARASRQVERAQRRERMAYLRGAFA